MDLAYFALLLKTCRNAPISGHVVPIYNAPSSVDMYHFQVHCFRGISAFLAKTAVNALKTNCN